MIAPTVHLNGTSKEALLQLNMNAASAVLAAIRALTEAHPNARDFYVQGPGAYKQAVDEHVARLDKLQDVLEELSELTEAISDQ